jgi:hypothetical protein
MDKKKAKQQQKYLENKEKCQDFFNLGTKENRIIRKIRYTNIKYDSCHNGSKKEK